MVYKNDYQGLPGKIPTDFATYAYYHLIKSEKNLENANLVFCDLTPSELSTSFILSLNNESRK
jgi:hypothetical protein